jgi:alkylation response protein AidB-like acyl-CoA dehydrogenase
MTETCSPGTGHPPEGPEKPGTIGLPLPGIEMDVVALDDPTKQCCRRRDRRDRVCAVPNVTRGYWNQPRRKPPLAFVGDGFLTGDIGYMDERRLFLSGRSQEGHDHLRRLQRLSADDRAGDLHHPSVQEVIVIGIPTIIAAKPPRRSCASSTRRAGRFRTGRRNTAAPAGRRCSSTSSSKNLQRAPAPQPLAFGVNMVGPVIYTFGNEEQKKRFLPRIANLDDWWCQGFSEPGAGSDLASLKTKAVREGDHYVVNGQKTWTTLAQHADWIFCLVRTDPEAKKQEGISFLLIDMKTPGITVRPIQTIDGGHEVNEVFFDNVKVPVENLVGEENRGWDYAKFLLGNERTNIARVGMSKERIRRIRELAGKLECGGKPLIEDPRFREKLAAVEIELKALEMTQMRVVAGRGKRGKGKPDPASSILKIKGSEIQQATTDLLMEVMGPSPCRTSRRRTTAATSFRRPRLRRPARAVATSTTARSRSTAARTRSSATSSRRRCSAN